MELLIFVLTSTCAWVFCHVLRCQLAANRLDFPSCWEIPLLGHLQLLKLVLSKRPLVDHQAIIERFPDFFKCWFLHFRFLCPHSPEAVRSVLRAAECLSRPAFARHMFSGFSGDAYREWIHKRPFMNRLFHVAALKTAAQPIVAAADDFCADLAREIDAEVEFDIYPWIARWTIKVHCLFMLGINDNATNGVIERLERFTAARNEIAHVLIIPQISKLFMPSKFAAMERTKLDLINFTSSLFTSQKTGEGAAKYAENYSQSLQRDDFPQQIISLMDAGFETVALNLTHVLIFLAVHRDIQQRVFEEIQSNSGEISYESLSKFELLERVIKETIRLAPPLPFLPREVHKDFEIEPGKVVETGTIVLIPNYGVHRLKSVWGADADRFNPDNFLPEAIAKRPQTSAFQFSHGKRMCIGHRYAMIVMKIFLTRILRKFVFEKNVEDLKFTAKVILSVDGSRNIKSRLRGK